MAAPAIMLDGGRCAPIAFPAAPAFLSMGALGAQRRKFIVFLIFKSWRGDIPHATDLNRKCSKNRLQEIINGEFVLSLSKFVVNVV